MFSVENILSFFIKILVIQIYDNHLLLCYRFTFNIKIMFGAYNKETRYDETIISYHIFFNNKY